MGLSTTDQKTRTMSLSTIKRSVHSVDQGAIVAAWGEAITICCDRDEDRMPIAEAMKEIGFGQVFWTARDGAWLGTVQRARELKKDLYDRLYM